MTPAQKGMILRLGGSAEGPAAGLGTAATQTACEAHSPSRQSEFSVQMTPLSRMDPQNRRHSPLSQSTSDWQSQPSPKSPNSSVHWWAMHEPTAQSASVSQEKQVMSSSSVSTRSGSSIKIRRRSVVMVSKKKQNRVVISKKFQNVSLFFFFHQSASRSFFEQNLFGAQFPNGEFHSNNRNIDSLLHHHGMMDQVEV